MIKASRGKVFGGNSWNEICTFTVHKYLSNSVVWNCAIKETASSLTTAKQIHKHISVSFNTTSYFNPSWYSWCRLVDGRADIATTITISLTAFACCSPNRPLMSAPPKIYRTIRPWFNCALHPNWFACQFHPDKLNWHDYTATMVTRSPVNNS